MTSSLSLRYKWFLAGFLALLGALNYADRTALNSVFPLLKQDLHLTDVQLGATGTMFLWTYGLLSPFAGYIADQVSRSRLIVVSLVGWSAVTLSTGFVTTSTSLLVTRALLAISECLYLPAAIALLADYHTSKTRGTAISLQICGTSLGMVAGGTLAGYMGDRYGWRLSFKVLGAFGFLLAIVAGRALRDVPRVRVIGDSKASWAVLVQTALREYGSLFRIPAYQLIVLQGIFQAIGFWVFIHWLPLYFKETFKMTLAAASFSGTFLLNAGQLAGTLMGGHSSDRISKGQPFRRMLFQGFGYLSSAPFLLVFLWPPTVAVTGTAIFFFGLARSLAISNENPFLCDLLAPKQRSRAIGFTNMTLSLGSGLGVLISGYFKQDLGLGTIFAAASGFMLTAGCILLFGFGGRDRHGQLASSQDHASPQC